MYIVVGGVWCIVYIVVGGVWCIVYVVVGGASEDISELAPAVSLTSSH